MNETLEAYPAHNQELPASQQISEFQVRAESSTTTTLLSSLHFKLKNYKNRMKLLDKSRVDI